jgi:hypothetical protein
MTYNVKKVPCFEITIEVVEKGCAPRFQTKQIVVCSSLSRAEEAGRALIPELREMYDPGKGEFRIESIRRLGDAYVEC